MEAGNTGSESDFLASLKGEKGDVGEAGADGTNGAAGTDGKDGASAYDVWLSAGNSGTEADFLASLKGEKGNTGEAGKDGINGVDGTDGVSPSAKVEKSGNVVTITITDENGTTTATLTEGAEVDLTPYAKTDYVDEKVQELSDSLTYTLQKHTQSIANLEGQIGNIATALADIVEVV